MEREFWPLGETQGKKNRSVFAIVTLCGIALLCVVFYWPQTLPVISQYEIDESHFRMFTEKYEKIYPSAEEKDARFQTFRTHLTHIRSHNAAGKSYILGLTKFADLTNEEFSALYSTRKTGTAEKRYSALPTPELPAEVNWVERGAVSQVKNQGFCGSCWAFAAAGAVESAYYLKTGKLMEFSEQQLLDCSKKFGNEGCEGGEMDDAYRYIEQNGGLEAASDYPYEANARRCRAKGSFEGAISGFKDIPKGSELQLKAAVAQQPVSVGVQANQVGWQLYESGVMDADCGQHLTHAVLVVGYGTDEKGGDYWLVKNTWGEDWGIGGYIKIGRNDQGVDGGLCGIALDASFPIFR